MVLLIYSKPLGIYTVGLSFSLCVPQEIPVPFQTSDAFQISPGDTFKRETLFYLCFPAWFRYCIRHIVFSLLKKIKQRNYRTQRKLPKWVSRPDCQLDKMNSLLFLCGIQRYSSKNFHFLEL